MKNEYLRVFKALSDEQRVRVLELLCEGETCACSLLEDLEISQPTLSHHMKILCESGIVRSRRAGKWNYYAIDEDGCKHAIKLIEAVADKSLGKLLLIGIMQRALCVLKRSQAGGMGAHVIVRSGCYEVV